MVRKQRLPTEKDVLKQLDIIENFNVKGLGKAASRKNASTFRAAKLEESTGKEFGRNLIKQLKNSKELL